MPSETRTAFPSKTPAPPTMIVKRTGPWATRVLNPARTVGLAIAPRCWATSSSALVGGLAARASLTSTKAEQMRTSAALAAFFFMFMLITPLFSEFQESGCGRACSVPIQLPVDEIIGLKLALACVTRQRSHHAQTPRYLVDNLQPTFLYAGKLASIAHNCLRVAYTRHAHA